jgi:hypothetical protein
MVDKKLESRIIKLEKMIKKMNESSYDISADIFQWFNKYCTDILNNSDGIEYLKNELKSTDIRELADEAISDLEADFGYDSYYLEDTDVIDQIMYDLDNLVADALNYIEYGNTADSSFARANADWLDKYMDNDAYSAALESRIRKLENIIKYKSHR